MFRPLSMILLLVVANALSATSMNIGKRSISQDLMDQFQRFTIISFSTYLLTSCSTPGGTTLVQSFNSAETNTQGFIARDDSAKQIIVAFRGSEQLQDFLTDVEIVLTPYTSPGVNNTNGALAHYGFLTAYNSVASDVISGVSSELEAYPDYSLISTGHSLGAALASLGGASLASNFPGVPLQVYTFGQPRTGDPAYADLVQDLVGPENLFRTVHTTDGVPTIIPQALGYRHHETEYWNFQDPSTSIDNVKQCTGQEDPTCSDSIPSEGIDIAHLTYFGENVIDDILDPSLACFQ